MCAGINYNSFHKRRVNNRRRFLFSPDAENIFINTFYSLVYKKQEKNTKSRKFVRRLFDFATSFVRFILKRYGVLLFCIEYLENRLCYNNNNVWHEINCLCVLRESIHIAITRYQKLLRLIVSAGRYISKTVYWECELICLKSDSHCESCANLFDFRAYLLVQVGCAFRINWYSNKHCFNE